MNLRLILETLRQSAPKSRAMLAELTGLNKASVSSMVRDLIAAGLVREMGIADAQLEAGRPAINLQLNPDAGYTISAEIGVGFISVIVTDFAFDIVTQRYESISPETSIEECLEHFTALLTDVYQQAQRFGRRVFGIAVGVPGLVDMERGYLLFAPNLQWRDIPLRDILQPHFDIPILVANEANLAAFGENYFGEGQHSRLLLYVSAGVGLGGGIVIKGKLLTGATGLASEFGHMTVVPDGLPCRCGSSGCWETLVAETALLRRVREMIQAGKHSPLARWKEHLTIHHVLNAAKSGDEVANAALAETGYWLGVGLASLINALNPEHVVFGGSLSIAHEILMPHVRAEIGRRALPWIWDQVSFRIAKHTANAAVMGGAALIHDRIVTHPLTWEMNREHAL
ncbi:MAG: ROK family transcriptional regulator [Chloroflexi bacterium]|nr:ROK family transcriptional regulator [Chloroflexota bacterium]